MALINEINGSMVQRLAASAGGSAQAASSSSSINGVGVAASFDGAKIDVRSGLQLGAEAFTRSLIRLSDSVGAFHVVRSKLSEIYSTVQELGALAEASADPAATDQDRVGLNSKFRAGISKLSEIYSSADVGERDYLEVSDLEEILSEAGVDSGAVTKLAQFFGRVGGDDGSLGFEKVRLDDETLVSPLLQHIDTQGNANNAVSAFDALASTVKADLDGIDQVLKELNAAANFAAAGSLAFGQLYESVLNSQDADTVAAEIVSKIRTRLSDNAIGPHSDLDTALSADLLS